MLQAEARAAGRFELSVDVESMHFLFETKTVEGFAEFPGCWLNKELPLPWKSMSG